MKAESLGDSPRPPPLQPDPDPDLAGHVHLLGLFLRTPADLSGYRLLFPNGKHASNRVDISEATPSSPSTEHSLGKGEEHRKAQQMTAHAQDQYHLRAVGPWSV